MDQGGPGGPGLDRKLGMSILFALRIAEVRGRATANILPEIQVFAFKAHNNHCRHSCGIIIGNEPSGSNWKQLFVNGYMKEFHEYGC